MDTKPGKIEIATGSDWDAVVRLVNDAYRGSSKAPGWTNETALLTGRRTDARSLQASIENDGSTLLVAKDDGHIVGCVVLQPLDGGTWYLSMLAVDPDYQARGVGTTIMTCAEAFAGARGAERIKISVIQQRESLIAWYERRGYVRTGELAPFPYEDPNVGTPLRADLTLVTLSKSRQP
jgi:ribosomal protein S18 acetylase RimI-like enzyme